MSKTNSVSKSYPDTGPQSHLFPISETLTAAPIVEPIYLPEASHASPSHAPGSDKARQTTVSSGLRCLGLFPRQDRIGSLVKMLLESSTWRSTTCYLTWKTKGTPAKRLLFQLAPSTPRTSATEFGLWPTARATEWMDPRGKTGNRKASIIRKTGWTLSEKVKLWPTPTAMSNTGGQAMCKWGGSGSREKLRTMVSPEELNGQLNPEWVTWLMGYPEGWTDISIPNPLTSPESLPESHNAQPA